MSTKLAPPMFGEPQKANPTRFADIIPSVNVTLGLSPLSRTPPPGRNALARVGNKIKMLIKSYLMKHFAQPCPR
ncbi:conserved hypothetical protein, partial [Ricinus communis]